MLSYYVIYYEKFKKVMQQTEKVALTLQETTFCSILPLLRETWIIILCWGIEDVNQHVEIYVK